MSESEILKPWHHRSDLGETPFAYEMFKKYLAMDPPRPWPEVAKTLDRDRGLIFNWNKKYQWAYRASLYDSYMRAQRGESVAAIEDILQEDLIAQAFEDVIKLRELWEAAYRVAKQNVDEGVIDITVIKGLIKTRDDLDLFARRTAKMPNTYSEAPALIDNTKEGNWLLTSEGPKKLTGGINAKTPTSDYAADAQGSTGSEGQQSGSEDTELGAEDWQELSSED